jgi:hypothetical protein
MKQVSTKTKGKVIVMGRKNLDPSPVVNPWLTAPISY